MRQNFANWYSYYRTRSHLAKAGILRAFNQLDSNIRVGWGRINNTQTQTIDGKSLTNVEQGVRPFDANHREKFWKWVFLLGANGPTPLRMALGSAGEYYDRADDPSNPGPWADNPETGSGMTGAACRKSFTVLMTDGYWYSDPGARVATGHQDGKYGDWFTTPPKPDNTTLNIDMAPFRDNYGSYMADVGWYYWAKDLLPEHANKVPGTRRDPAWWQHVTTYTISIGMELYTANKEAAFHAADNGAPFGAGPTPPLGFAWPAMLGDLHPTKLDDLLHTAVNGHGDFIAAQNTQDFADGMNAIIASVSDSVASSGRLGTNEVTPGAKDDAGDPLASLAFSSAYRPIKWSGTVTASKIRPAGGGVEEEPAWEASAKLPPPDERKIFTRKEASRSGAASTGIAFKSDKLEQWQITALAGGDEEAKAADVAQLVDFLRGSKTHEQGQPGVVNGYRSRERTAPAQSPLGDSPHSAPHYHAPTNTVYIGANDGMLHAFAATDDDDTGVKGGEERFAYIPSALFGIPSQQISSKLNKLADANYEHQHYVDGEAVAANSPVNGRYYLVGSLGRGGAGLYGLDVTHAASNPTADEMVKWEQNGDCATPSTATTATQELGLVLGKPSFFYKNGATGSPERIFVAVGNGYNSCTGKATLIILDAATGEVIQKLVVSSEIKNGLSTPILYDANSDGYPDYIYAGDLKGKLWRFEPEGAARNGQFKVSYGGKALFIAKNDNNEPQPITAQPAAMEDKSNDRFVFFGTGKFLELSDKETVENQKIQTLYAVIDKTAEITRATLAARTLKEATPATPASGKWELSDKTEIITFRYVDPEPAPNDMAGKNGWYIDLDNGGAHYFGERIIAKAAIQHGGAANGYALIVPTIIPSNDPCEKGARSDVLTLRAFTGAPLVDPIVDVNGDGVIDDNDKIDTDGKSVVGASFGIEQAVLDFVIDVCDGNVPLLIGSLTPTNPNHNIIITNSQPPRSCDEPGSSSRGIRGRISWREIVK
jgi:type IV pilus assembly protein PilY1